MGRGGRLAAGGAGPDAAFGDLVDVIAPIAFLAVAGLRVSRALVTAPGFVTIYVINHTGGGLTPASGSGADPWCVSIARPIL